MILMARDRQEMMTDNLIGGIVYNLSQGRRAQDGHVHIINAILADTTPAISGHVDTLPDLKKFIESSKLHSSL